MRTHAICFGALATLAFASPASAQQTTAQQQRAPRILDRIARNHFELGNDYFQVSRYDDAAREFQAAYDITHQDELLFNIGRAKESAGDIRGALDAYERFDRAGAPGFDREVLHERMDNLRARIAASASAAPPPQETTASASPAPSAAPHTETTTASAAPPTQSAAPSGPVRVVYHRSALMQYGPIVAIGLGVVAGGIAVWQALTWSSDSATLNNVNHGMGSWDSGAMSAYNNVAIEGTVAWILGGAAVVLIGGGLATMALRGPGEREEVPVTTAFVTPVAGGAVFGVGGAL